MLELLVVMVIIGLLASFVAPKFFSQVGKSEIKTARAQMDAFGKALDTYRLDVGRYPSTALGLKALVDRPESEPKKHPHRPLGAGLCVSKPWRPRKGLRHSVDGQGWTTRR